MTCFCSDLYQKDRRIVRKGGNYEDYLLSENWLLVLGFVWVTAKIISIIFGLSSNSKYY